MMYGARAALFMDVSNPRVAATQFTAYMALLNLGIAYSARWQGWAVDRYGYPHDPAGRCIDRPAVPDIPCGHGHHPGAEIVSTFASRRLTQGRRQEPTKSQEFSHVSAV